MVAPVVLLAAAGLLGGWLWSVWSDPALYTVSGTRTVLDEAQLGMLFGIEVRYGVIGLVGGLVVAAPVSARLSGSRWSLVAGVVVGAAAATALSYLLGVALGPGNPTSAARAAAPGDLVPAALVVRTPGLLLGWLIGALAGLLAGAWYADRSPG